MGGFGQVWKGILKGAEVAVKMALKLDGEDLELIQNELIVTRYLGLDEQRLITVTPTQKRTCPCRYPTILIFPVHLVLVL